MAAKSQSGGGCLATVVGVAILFLIGKCAGAVDAAPPPEVPTMPDVSGMHLDVATEKVDALGEEFSRFPHSDGADLTVDGRYPHDEEEWTVVTSKPLPGQPMPTSLDEGDTYLFVLRNEEWAWLQANATMPALPTGGTSEALVGPGGPMEGVADLVEWIYSPDAGMTGKARTAAVVEPLYGLTGTTLGSRHRKGRPPTRAWRCMRARCWFSHWSRVVVVRQDVLLGELTLDRQHLGALQPVGSLVVVHDLDPGEDVVTQLEEWSASSATASASSCWVDLRALVWTSTQYRNAGVLTMQRKAARLFAC